MSRPRVSVVSVYNDERILEEWTAASVADQDYDAVETVFIDNTEKQYDTAPAALNAGGRRASGEYLLFVHQDVRFLVDDWLSQAVGWLDGLEDYGIAGLTGMVGAGEGQNVIWHGIPPAEYPSPPAGYDPDPFSQPALGAADLDAFDRESLLNDHPELLRPWFAGQPIDEPVPVRTIDEFCLILPRDQFERRQFAEDVCDGWHCYGVEYSLHVRHRTDRTPYVLPLPAWHRSTGMDLGPEFWRILQQVAEEYHDETDWITATTGTFHTGLQRRGIRGWDTALYGATHPRQSLRFLAERGPQAVVNALRR